MKHQVSNKQLWNSLKSLLTLLIFIWLAAGSSVYITDYAYESEILEDGRTQTKWTNVGPQGQQPDIVFTAKKDDYGRWQGPYTKEATDYPPIYAPPEIQPTQSLETGIMVNGNRHGSFEYYFRPSPSEEYQLLRTDCYDMGKRISCNKSESMATTNQHVFDQMLLHYPYFIYDYNAFGFENEFIEEFYSELVREIQSYDVEVMDFNKAYDDAMDELGDTEQFENIVDTHLFLAYMESINRMLEFELRMAVVDRYRSGNKRTFDFIRTTYTGFLTAMYMHEVTDEQCEAYCDRLDAVMDSYGPLDQNIPFFIDSVDNRFSTAIYMLLLEYISEEDEDEDKKNITTDMSIHNTLNKTGDITPRDILRTINQTKCTLSNKLLKEEKNPAAAVTYILMMSEIQQSDPLRRIIFKEIFPNIARLAELTTSIAQVMTINSIKMHGHIIDDGGATVTDRGIAYSTTYNPTVDHHIEQSGTGSGVFAVDIAGLTPGITYYARAFATNKAGTAYGNIISFRTDSETGITFNLLPEASMKIYPVPVTDMLWVEINNLYADEIKVSLINVSGQQISSQVLKVNGSEKLSFNVAGLTPGIYFVRATTKDNSLIRKVIIQ